MVLGKIVILLSDFFFQAEDGIRDQPRSRGLGDVYKRQRQVLFFLLIRRAFLKKLFLTSVFNGHTENT